MVLAGHAGTYAPTIVKDPHHINCEANGATPSCGNPAPLPLDAIRVISIGDVFGNSRQV